MSEEPEMTMTCDVVQRAVWSRESDPVAAAHLESCSACRTEAARAGQMQTAFVSLRDEVAETPGHLHSALMAMVADATHKSPSLPVRLRRLPGGLSDGARRVIVRPGFRGAAVGAAAAASAAAFVGVILVRRLARAPAAG